MIIVSRAHGAIAAPLTGTAEEKNVDLTIRLSSDGAKICAQRIPISIVVQMRNRVSQRPDILYGHWKSRLFLGEMNALCNFNYTPKRH